MTFFYAKTIKETVSPTHVLQGDVKSLFGLFPIHHDF